MIDYTSHAENTVRLHDVESVHRALVESDEDSLRQLEDLMAYSLQSPTATVRRAAIELLTVRWGLKRYRTAASLMAEMDSDPTVRAVAQLGFETLSLEE